MSSHGSQGMELLTNFIVECGVAATVANFDIRLLRDNRKIAGMSDS
jgi:hypothetical protein